MHAQGDIPRRSYLIEHRAESSEADDPQPWPILLNQRATETNPSGVQELSSLSSCYDPMAYPLLFPFGDHGWSKLMEHRGRGQTGSKVTTRDFYAFRIMDRTSGPVVDTVDTVATNSTQATATTNFTTDDIATAHQSVSSERRHDSNAIVNTISNVSQANEISASPGVGAAITDLIEPVSSNVQPDNNHPNTPTRFNRLLHHAGMLPKV
jgi:hypothetical protein